MNDLGFRRGSATEIYVDYRSAFALAKDPMYWERSKLIDTRYYFIRKHAKQGSGASFLQSQDQVANILTKPLKLRF